MSRGRKPILVDKVELQAVINQVEQAGPLGSRSALWLAVADTEWAKSVKLSPQVAMLKAKALNVVIKTPLGLRGRAPGSGPVPNAGTGKRGRKRIPLDIVDMLKKAFVPELHSKVDRAAGGSMKAAIALKCIDCSGGSKKEVGLCPIKDCALWCFRPYQGKYREDSASGK